MKSNFDDYLKYWRVIRQYVKIRYEISQADLDMLLFLYSEGYFGKDKFKEFSELVSWDVKRFDRMLKDGWIENFRPRRRGVKGLYSLSFKAKRMIKSIYKKLSGEEIPMTAENNPMFKKNVSYSDKVYRNMIRTMNAHTKKTKLTGQELHHVPE
jgi:hypothetical protein